MVYYHKYSLYAGACLDMSMTNSRNNNNKGHGSNNNKESICVHDEYPYMHMSRYICVYKISTWGHVCLSLFMLFNCRLTQYIFILLQVLGALLEQLLLLLLLGRGVPYEQPFHQLIHAELDADHRDDRD